jgi:hypothetical protein
LGGNQRDFGQFGLQRTGLLSEQNFQAMRRGLDQTFKRRNCRACRGQHSQCLSHIQIGGDAVGETVLRDGEGFFLREKFFQPLGMTNTGVYARNLVCRVRRWAIA